MVKLSKALTLSDLGAMKRALEDRAAGIRPTRIAPKTYEVASSSRPEVTYVVTIINAGALLASCTCPHGIHEDSKGRCRHTANALMAEFERVSKPARRNALS